ncbi:MAG: TIGR01212 family radical SAM protein, partial [Bacteroidetes bacterium HGW-Bacteroidetes-22]
MILPVFPRGKRYNSYNEYFKRTFGSRVQKLSVDAGFTCPNRDGTVASGGCTYCNNDAFNPSYCQPNKTVTMQLEEGKQFHAWRYRRAVNYLAYFQAFSNTYAPLPKLRELYDEALAVPGVIGLVIGTRPDCVDEEKLDYFATLAEKYYVIIEYGIESCYDQTLCKINRGHSFEEAVKAVKATAQRGIRVG